MRYLQGLMDFINAAPTAFHAVDQICASLASAGYARLQEGETWFLEPGGRYYLTRNRSSVIAFRLPRQELSHFQIVASHSDSPCFKLKPNAQRASQGCALLNVEKYGGMLMSTWLDRPLSIAGRLIVEDGGALETVLVDAGRDLALIPNVPIHFNRDANDGVKWNPQVDMLPIYGTEGADYLCLLSEKVGVEPSRVAGGDLFLYNRDRATLFGAQEEFIAAPRLDDLECAYTSLEALLASRPGRHVDMLCVFDNEEVGSGSKQGADSTLLADTLRRIAGGTGLAPQALEAAVAKSFMVSADNAHAAHPNHPEKYDEQNRVYMNSGVVVKSSANQKYTSDALSIAVFESICRRAGVPTQRFANRSDIPGGSTLGNISNAHVSMNAVDIGLAQLAMHSALETAGARDVAHMVDALKAFFECEVMINGDGAIRIE